MDAKLDQITEAVCTEFEVSRSKLLARGRVAEVVEARLAAHYVARRVTKLGFVELGAFFGRNHSSVSHGFQKVKSLTRTGSEFSEKVERVIRSCRDEATG